MNGLEAAVEVDPDIDAIQQDVDPIEGDIAAPEGLEAEAKQFGWKPPEDWVGDGQPMDAEAWMTRGPGLARKQKSRIDELEAKVKETTAQTEARIERLDRANRQAAEARIRAEVEAIKAKQLEAVEVGDTEKFQELEAEKEKVAAPSVHDNPEAQEVSSWIAAQDWWNSDTARTAAAGAYFVEAEKRGVTSLKERLRHVEEKLKEDFPHHYAPKPKPVQKVDPGGLGIRPNAKTRWDDIPADDRKIAMGFIKDGDFDALAKEQGITAQQAYAKIYFGDEE